MDLSINCLDLVPFEKLPKAEDISNFPLENISQMYNIFVKMEEVCKTNNGVGLAAPQLGLPYNLFICLNSKKGFDYYVNSIIIDYGTEKVQSIEGCLSIRSSNGCLRHFQLERSKNIFINCFKLDGESLELKKIENLELDGMDAIVFQHEMDHCLGLSIADKGKEFFIFS